MFNTSYGFQNLLKEGHKHYSGLEEAVLRNIDACKEVSNITKTSLGPNAMKKMVVNHLDKIFVTSDAATIMKEMEVNHPAAKMVAMASKMQENEFGDASNFVVTFAGELLTQAESLIKMGLHPNQVLTGYENASKMVSDLLNKQKIHTVTDVRNVEAVNQILYSSLFPKLQSHATHFSALIAEACIGVLPKNAADFNIENVRTSKISGGGLNDSAVIRGLVVARGTETLGVNSVKDAKIAVYNCAMDTQTAETKGTIIIKSADELLNYNKSEEELSYKFVKSIADSGANVVVAGGSISELVLHYLEKYRIMTIKVTSKFELRRISKLLGATTMFRIGAPTPDEFGHASTVELQEIGSARVTVFKRDDKDDCKLATLVIRGSSTNLLDDVERAVDDGVHTFANMCKDPRFVYGAGSCEIALAKELETIASSITGLDQYSFKQYAKAFEIIPRILSQNSGLNEDEIVAKLYASHSAGTLVGIDVENQTVKNSDELKVYDHLDTKLWAIRLASDAAITILRVDQIIISKPAGGPKPQKNTNWDEDN